MPGFPLARRTAALALAGMVLTGAATLPASAAQRALLIGISAYEHIPKLNGPRQDLPKMKSFLKDHWGFEEDAITVLQDADATADKIVAAIEEQLIEKTDTGDRIVIYYSGHGSQLPDDNGDEDDGLDETLSPVDTTEDGRNQITDDVFGALLERMSDRNVTVIIDSCHSGTVSRSAGTFTDAEHEGSIARTFVPVLTSRSATQNNYDVEAHRKEVSFVKTKGTLEVWSAAASNQLSWDTPAGGVFTGYFVEGMSSKDADENKNGVVTNSELLAYVRSKTKSYCAKNPICRGYGFTPALEADDTALQKTAVPLGEKTEDVTEIIVQDNRANVEIEVLPKDRISAGEEIRFRVTSDRRGHLILLDFNAKGEVTQLVPNEIMDKHNRGAELHPNEAITVPDAYYGFRFTASEPFGEGTLIAIVTEDRMAIDDLLDANRAMSVVAKPEQYLAQLVSALMDIWRDDEQNRALNWSLATRKYVIQK